MATRTMTGEAGVRRWRFLALPITVAGVFQASPALAQTRPNNASPDVVIEGVIRDDQRRVCKQTTATGSIIPARVCRTKADWDRIYNRQISQLNQLKRDMDRDRHTRQTIEVLCGGVRC